MLSLLYFLIAASAQVAQAASYIGPGPATPFIPLQGLGDGLNFKFDPSDSPQPFTIDVDPNFVAATKLKASLYRPTKPITEPDWESGPPTADINDLAQYFAQNYSWLDTQKVLNDFYTQYTTTVSAGPNYTESTHVHFAHEQSERQDAIPLLMLHGFPSSFLEFIDVIKPLAHPPNDSLPAFHVVTPSLPGFGFSPAPTADHFGSREAGIAFDNLMHQLGYDRYAIYVTDLGTAVGNWMVFDAADSIFSRITSFYIVNPTAEDQARYAANETTPEETFFIEQLNDFIAEDYGYISIQTTKPLSLAEGLTDSPVGFIAWTWNYRYHASGAFGYTLEDLITQAYLLYIQGTYSPFHAYKTWWEEGALNSSLYPTSDLPTGVLHFQSGDPGRDDTIQYAVSVLLYMLPYTKF